MKSKLCAAAALALAITMLSSGTAFAAYNSEYFGDVNEDSYGWSAEAVDYLFRNQVVSGIGEGKFAPAKEIKRCDFVVLVDRAFKLVPFSDYVANFNDISKDDYYYTAVVNAKGVGIIKNDYAFYPQVPITRGDAMQMLYAALDNSGYIKNASTDLSMYSDADDVRDVNSQLAIGTLTQMGIISGSEGKIMFTSTMTRAEMAMVFYKTLTYMEEHPVQAKQSEKKTETKTTKTDNTKTEEEITETESKETEINDTVFNKQDYKQTVVVDGEEITGIDGAKVRVGISSTNSVEIANGVKADIKDSLIQAMGVNSSAVRVTRDASTNITQTQLTAGNNGANGVTGSDSTKVVITGGKVIIDGNKASGVYTSGRADIKDTSFSVEKGSAVTAENSGKITVEGAKIEAKGGTTGLFYAVTGKGEDKGSANITVKNSEITGDRRTTLFYANNNDLTATLENCKVEKVAKLVDSGATSDAKGSGSSRITINLVNQKLTADVDCEEISRVTINLKKGSHLIAAINSQNSAEYVEINVEDGSTLELVENSYIHYLNYDSIYDIYEQGHVIYYDGDDSRNREMQNGDYPLANGGHMTPMDK